jgi:hypothetical protein
MFDLQILAFQADITRVVTFQLTREQSNRSYLEVGIPEPHHPTSHHGNNPEKLLAIAKINTFHVSLFSDFLQRMKDTPDGDGSLSIIRSICTAAAWGTPAFTITRICRSWSRAAPPPG